jgi:hypothetical protein
VLDDAMRELALKMTARRERDATTLSPAGSNPWKIVRCRKRRKIIPST